MLFATAAALLPSSSLCLVFLAFEKKKAERYAAIMDEGRLKLFFLVWY